MRCPFRPVNVKARRLLEERMEWVDTLQVYQAELGRYVTSTRQKMDVPFQGDLLRVMVEYRRAVAETLEMLRRLPGEEWTESVRSRWRTVVELIGATSILEDIQREGYGAAGVLMRWWNVEALLRLRHHAQALFAEIRVTWSRPEKDGGVGDGGESGEG